VTLAGTQGLSWRLQTALVADGWQIAPGSPDFRILCDAGIGLDDVPAQRDFLLGGGRLLAMGGEGPLLARLSDLLMASPRLEPGLFNPFDSGYLERVEAMDFTVRHDDGRNVHELDQADLVLIGVSRTSKTPLSIYLGYRGWRVANIPLVYGVPAPKQLFQIPAYKVVALTAEPQRLASIRQVRAKHMKSAAHGYADLTHVERELAYAYEIFSKRKKWPIVDVTVKTIEETATEVISLIPPPRRLAERKTDFAD
jgi:regulator of PEP synthase PpsR (kinase-PPPase family)